MPKRTIDSALDALEFLKQGGAGEKVPSPLLIKAIRLRCGARSDVVKRYLEFMKMMNFVIPAGEENGVPMFRIDWEEIYKVAV